MLPAAAAGGYQRVSVEERRAMYEQYTHGGMPLETISAQAGYPDVPGQEVVAVVLEWVSFKSDEGVLQVNWARLVQDCELGAGE